MPLLASLKLRQNLKRADFWGRVFFLLWALNLGGLTIWSRQKHGEQALKESTVTHKAQDLKYLHQILYFLENNKAPLERLLRAQKIFRSCSLTQLAEKIAEVGRDSGLKELALTLRSSSLKNERGRESLGSASLSPNLLVELTFLAPCERSCFSFIQSCWHMFPGVFRPQNLFLESVDCAENQSVWNETIKGRYLLAFMTQ